MVNSLPFSIPLQKAASSYRLAPAVCLAKRQPGAKPRHSTAIAAVTSIQVGCDHSKALIDAPSSESIRNALVKE